MMEHYNSQAATGDFFL